MLRFRMHPTPAGLFLGLAVIALWAALWIWFFAQIARDVRSAQRQPRVSPELALRMEPRSASGRATAALLR